MSEFIEYLHELFEGFGPIRTRKMFGGYGVYRDDVMFALVADDTLYLKVDDESALRYQTHGLPQFQYAKDGKTVGMSYYMAPEEALEDPEVLADWANQAYEIAFRLKKGQKNKG